MMSLPIFLKRVFANCLVFFGIIEKKIMALEADRMFILMYHRIINPENSFFVVQPGMYVTPETFENHLQFLIKHFEIIPLNYLSLDNIEESFVAGKPSCVLTFDDGWIDFYQYTFPLLKKYNVPATVFLPTDYIGSDRWFWTDRFSWMLKKIENCSKPLVQLNSGFDPAINRIINTAGSFEDKLEFGINILKVKHLDNIDQILNDLSLLYDIKGMVRERMFISWEEVREMKHSGLVSFGSHTAGHPILTTIDDYEITNELEKSKIKLIEEGAVDSSFIPFCYPNGNYNSQIEKMVVNSGYNLAVTTQNGWVTSLDKYKLKRVGIHQDMTSSKAMLGCRILGIF